MERPPDCKKDEQYPLLKVANGLGDSIRQPPPAQTQSWTVTCAPKQSWLQRWPEIISASWMTLVLLGMLFLIFYALGMGAYRRPSVLVRFNDANAQPSSNVFLHHILHRGCHLPFALFSPYLSSMSFKYPNLRFNVIFLVDDAMRNNYYVPRHGRLPSGFLGYHTKDEILKQDMIDFESRHANVNITVAPLNKFMAMTPLRFKWRTIPVSYLSFYTRLFSVWQNGGIGMDLATFNNQFCNNFRFDRRVSEILKNHNEGLPVKDYNILLHSIDDEEDTAISGLRQLLTDSVFGRIFPSGLLENLLPSEIMPGRAQRTKRNIDSNFYEIEASEDSSRIVSNILTDVKLNDTLEEEINNGKDNNTNNDLFKIEAVTEQSNVTTAPETTLKLEQELNTKVDTVGEHNTSNNYSEGPQAILLYDFSIRNIGHFLNDPLWPPLLAPFGFNSNIEPLREKKRNTNSPAQLALGSDGIFVAANDKIHPFLGMLITAGFQRLRPEIAIQDAIITQCSGVYKNEPYCNIYVF